ncbi:amidohydrolase family protein [Aceticella autotrophica]|uniref:Amidohydrolase family protein n=1 Tax=Aceticella autotrophica TaxID=2755338 RepID=A0A975GAL8_9THEO|nr:amidohydrolase family protein [Aceticella autotrophica]QSZ27311.1 amidohydrolase family protein [Aceticella autotrophica]
MKIDAHVHILSPDFIKDIKKNIERDQHFKLLHSNPKAKFAVAEDVLKDMDKTGIDKSVVFGFSALEMGMCREANDYIIDVVKRYPDRFIGFAIVPPKDPGMEKELVRCYEAGLKGVGEIIPDAVHVDISKQEEIGKFASLCRELKFPILMHSNETVGHYYPGKGKTGPDEAYLFAINNPDNIIIYAHWGGGLFFYELMPELQKDLKNVYYDTAASPYLYKPQVYEAARTAGVLNKVLLGSDFPLLSPSRYYKEWSQTNLTEEEKLKINGLNASSILLSE